MTGGSCITCGVLIVLTATIVSGISYSVQNDVRRTFMQELLDTLGNGSSISQGNIKDYLIKQNSVWKSTEEISECFLNISGTIQLKDDCLQNQCLSPEEVYELSGLDQGVTDEHLSTLSAILLLLSENEQCHMWRHLDYEERHGNKTHTPPSAASVWGFGFLCTTLINLCSLTGVAVLPFIHGKMYKGMLIYMVGLAVGTLCGSSVLFLIPEALELTDQELNEDSYIWKCLTVIIGIYLFFLIERILKMITIRQEQKKALKLKTRQRIHRDSAMSFASFHKGKEIPDYRRTEHIQAMPCCNNESQSSIEDGSLSDQENDMKRNESAVTFDNKSNVSNVTRKPLMPKSQGHSHVAPVAYMIIFGDGLHNFIDGVSIGAAFTESILAGVSVSIAILCEEFPHELGDFAVLLNAGMKIKRAVLYNFLSATMCYLGLVVGIFLGENTSTHTWVFAFAGGMFLYISLVDMMPEMNGAAEDPENKIIVGTKAIFILQNVGLVTGFVLMMLMAVYGGHLEAAIQGH